jgi:exonuclease III
MPTELDTYKPERYQENALFRKETRKLFNALLKQGWTDPVCQLHSKELIYTFRDYLRHAYGRDAGLRLDRCFA